MGCTGRAPHDLVRPQASPPIVGFVDNRAEVKEFLTTRRAKLSAAQAGLPQVGGRRVPGLRRSEVAALAGISVEYYAKLERGALAGASPSVLDALARALQLNDAERSHLHDLARAADGTSGLLRPRRTTSKRWTPRPSLQCAQELRRRRAGANWLRWDVGRISHGVDS